MKRISDEEQTQHPYARFFSKENNQNAKWFAVKFSKYIWSSLPLPLTAQRRWSAFAWRVYVAVPQRGANSDLNLLCCLSTQRYRPSQDTGRFKFTFFYDMSLVSSTHSIKQTNKKTNLEAKLQFLENQNSRVSSQKYEFVYNHQTRLHVSDP